MLWLGLINIIFFVMIIILAVKIRLMQKAAEEIEKDFSYSILHETNNLIVISCRDKYMRRLSERINEELRLLRRARHRFQQGDLEMREAVTNISHDLRTPLTAICGYLELLREERMCPDAQPEAVERYLEIIDERTRNLKKLTEELFCYTVAANTPKKWKWEEISLGSVLEEVISTFYRGFNSRGIEPCISIPEKKVVRRLDKNGLVRILENILSNAIKYSDGDLKISLKENGRLTFENHASSLDQVQVSRFFDRFYTVETAQHSTGLGLSIARSLTEQMGGKIDASYSGSILCILLDFPER